MSMREANALHRAGRSVDASRLIERHLRSNPQDHAAHQLLGTIAHAQGDHEGAVKSMRESVRLAPSNPAYAINLAAALGRMGQYEEGLGLLLAALKSAGNIPELHCNLGVTFEALERIAEAVHAYQAALELRPNYPEAHFNLGNALRKGGRFQAAANAYARALRLRPNYTKVFDGLGACALELGDIDQLVACSRKAVDSDRSNAGARSSLLYTLHYHPDMDAQTLSKEHSVWGQLFCQEATSNQKAHDNDRSPERRIRLGYISPDLREHTVPHFVSAALKHHDLSQFEVYCYSDVERSDSVTAGLREMVEHWREIRGKSDDAVEKLIREDQIDILVDLRGHAGANRLLLFARRPAPVQINMVGYFDTTGLPAMDYRVTDELQDPPGETEHLHSERLIRIAGGCWCYTPSDYAPPLSEPPVIRNGHVTFGSLNKIIKVSRPCAQHWAKVLNAVPGSRLLLSVVGQESAAVVRRRLAEAGIPIQRIMMADKTSTGREYLSRFNEIDIALDTFPFNGITTTCDGLWMGVPVVSLAGNTSVSRSGTSILHAANLPQFATTDPDSFVRVAANLATDREGLRNLRLGMREHLLASGLMDHRGFASKLESAFRQAWRDWCNGSPRKSHPMHSPTHNTFFGEKPIQADTDLLSRDTEPLFEAAIAHYQAGRLAEAEAKYREVLRHDPKHARALHMIGFLAYRDGRRAEAIELIGKAIEADAAEAEFRNNLGVVLVAGGEIQLAIDAYRDAIALRPEYPEAHCNLGTALQLKGELESAIDAYRHALDQRPDYIEAHCNMGTALMATGRYGDAITRFHTVLALEPDNLRARIGLGNTALAAGRYDQAIARYREALKLRPQTAEAHKNIGWCLEQKGELERAIGCYQDALSIDPNYAEARFAMSTALLLQGNFKAGWKGYESRWAANRVKIPEVFAARRWDGSELNGKRILLQAEQGLGDTIQFIRYAELVAARDGRVLIQCRPELLRLLKGQCQIAELFTGSKDLPAFDAYCPLLSLPHIFDTTLETIPSTVGYLKPEGALAEAWQQRFAAEPPGLRVGLAWAGDPGHRRDAERSIGLQALEPLGKIPGARFYSLQTGPAANQLKLDCPEDFAVTDWTDSLKDLADTAAMLMGLDLVITVDTAVAHLAAALGKKTWTLLPFAPDWRWMTARQDSPWYPTMKLFRQPQPGRWQEAVKTLSEELAGLGPTQTEVKRTTVAVNQ